MNVQKCQCILCSQEPCASERARRGEAKQREIKYMKGAVPFDFKNRNAVADAEKKFRANPVWEVAKPAFDPKAKPIYNGCPVKADSNLKVNHFSLVKNGIDDMRTKQVAGRRRGHLGRREVRGQQHGAKLCQSTG